MKRISKRVLAAVLTLCMLVSLVPMMASAAVRTDPRWTISMPESGSYAIISGGANGKFDDLGGPTAVVGADGSSYDFVNDASRSIRYYTNKGSVSAGVVEMSFDIAITTAEGPRMESPILVIGGQSMVSIVGNEIHLGAIGGNGVSLGAFASDANPETEETVNASGTVVLKLDFDNDTLTGSYAGGEEKSIAMTATSFKTFVFTLGMTLQTSNDTMTDLTMNLSNMRASLVSDGVAPTVESSSNGAIGIGLTQMVSVDYNGAITAVDSTKISVTDASGAPVSVAAVASGTTLLIGPATTWAELTTYTVNVGAGAVKVYGTNNAESSFSFTTAKAGNPAKLDFTPNFAATGDMTAAQLGGWLHRESTYSNCDSFKLHSSYLMVNGAAVESASSTAATAADNITVEGGAIHFKATNTQQELRLIPANSANYTGGYLKVSFDVGFAGSASPNNDLTFLTINNSASSTDLALTWARSGTAAMRIDGTTNILLTEGSSLTAAVNLVYPVMHKVEVLVNLDTGNVKYAINGSTKAQIYGETSNAGGDLSFNKNLTSVRNITLKLPKDSDASYTVTDMYVKNLSVKHLDAASLTASVTDGAEGVSVVAPMSLASNVLLPASYWNGVTLAPTAGGDNADITVTPDATGYGAKIKINTALATNTPYTLTLPAYTAEFTGTPLAAKTINFTTSAVAETLYVSDYTVPAVAAGQNMAASATFGYAGNGSQTVMVGFGLYGAGDVLLKAAYTEYTFTEAGSQTVRANFTAPAELAAGAYVKVFAWKGGVAAMQPICAPLS